MSDLRKAAQDVLDRYDADDGVIDVHTDFDIMEALRAALAETPEAVAWARNTPYGRAYSYAQEFLDAHPDFPLSPSVDALIAEAIEKHDDEMSYAKTVNTRLMAQPYLDEMIAEIDALLVPNNFTYQTLLHKSYIEKVLNKYRAK